MQTANVLRAGTVQESILYAVDGNVRGMRIGCMILGQPFK